MSLNSKIFFVAICILFIIPESFAFQLGYPVAVRTSSNRFLPIPLKGWVEDNDGEWEWKEDDPTFIQPSTEQVSVPQEQSLGLQEVKAKATPKLPTGSFKPKQSLGQNFLRDGNTVMKIINSFVADAKESTIENDSTSQIRAIELGPGAGALTDTLVPTFQDLDASFQCIEIDPRSIELLREKHPGLVVHHLDVLQADYTAMAKDEGGPLSIIGNLPYYITSQILFALADASHNNAIRSATVTMQYEVGQRVVANTRTKDYGILTVVFQIYADCKLHFKIPPTVFYPKPKVDSALIGLHFLGPNKLRDRLCGVKPANLRRVVTATFQQRRKTVRNGLKKLVKELYADDNEKGLAILDSAPLPLSEGTIKAREKGDTFALTQELPIDWAKKRPEELSPGQFIELTRLVFRDQEIDDSDKSLGKKVWRKDKHGDN